MKFSTVLFLFCFFSLFVLFCFFLCLFVYFFGYSSSLQFSQFRNFKDVKPGIDLGDETFTVFTISKFQHIWKGQKFGNLMHCNYYRYVSKPFITHYLPNGIKSLNEFASFHEFKFSKNKNSFQKLREVQSLNSDGLKSLDRFIHLQSVSHKGVTCPTEPNR